MKYLREMPVQTLLYILLGGCIVVATITGNLLPLLVSAVPPLLGGYLLRLEGSFDLRSKRGKMVAGVLIALALFLIAGLMFLPREFSSELGRLLFAYFSSCLYFALQSRLMVAREGS